MFQYILKRIGASIITLWVIINHHFHTNAFYSEDPLAEKELPESIKAALMEKYHLNEPLSKQYIIYLEGLLHGDLGPSMKYPGENVQDLIKKRISCIPGIRFGCNCINVGGRSTGWYYIRLKTKSVAG